jgi:heme/copper-type cytochrome/quinol oxidase subunit 4
MSEPENKKPVISKLAVFSFLLVLLGLAIMATIILFENIEIPEIIVHILVGAVFLFLLSGLVFGVQAFIQIIKSKGSLWGLLFSVLAIFISAGFVISSFWPMPPIDRNRMMCFIHLDLLDIVMHRYADEHNNTYPESNRWCDLAYHYIEDPNLFICPGAFKHGDNAKCHYAMNPNCEPNSPNDVVLLFETRGGWNQYGGPELLKFDNHTKKGAAVGFNDGHVEFVKPEDVNKLKWK